MDKKLKKIIQKFPRELQNLLNISIFNEFWLSKTFSGYIFLVFLEYIGFFLSFFGYRINDKKTELKNIPPSLYSMSFLPSGAGKDFMLKQMRIKVFIDVWKEIGKKIEESQKILIQKIEEEANEKFNEPELIIDEKIMIQRKLWIDRKIEQEVRTPAILSTNSTMEGLQADRLMFQKIGVGASFYLNKELCLYYKKYNEQKNALDSYLLEASEDGNTTGKSIKSDKCIIDVNNVPVCCHLHTTILEELPVDLFEFMRYGGARRILFFYKKKNKKNKEFKSDEEFINYIMNLRKGRFKKIRVLINQIMNSTQKLKLSNEARILYLTSSYKYSKSTNPNISNIPWRALKISLIIEKLLNPDSKEISLLALDIAIAINKYYSDFYQKLIGHIDAELEEKALDVIVEVKKITLTSLMRKLKIKLMGSELEDFVVAISELAEVKKINIKINKTNRGLSFEI